MVNFVISLSNCVDFVKVGEKGSRVDPFTEPPFYLLCPNSRADPFSFKFPVSKWYDLIGDPTLADAILDRLIHSAYKIDLKGGSMRKKKSVLTKSKA